MRWRRRVLTADEREAWIDWFAWRPVMLEDETWVWLEMVQRSHRVVGVNRDGAYRWAPVYRDRPLQPGDQYL